MSSLIGCSDEQSLPVGEGKIFLSARVNSDVAVVSRSETEEDLAATTQIWISNSSGVVRKYNSISELPSQGITLLSGEYQIKAWAGSLAYASFTDRWFEGEETVEILTGDRKSIEVTCKIANVCASVSYDEEIAKEITDATLTIGHRGGTLDFEGTDDNRRGYFMMPEGITSLDWTLTISAQGKTFTKTGVIENVQPAHDYRLNILSDNGIGEIGGAWFTIEVDDTMIEVEDNVVITTPPAISGYGFDIKKPINGASGTIGRKSVFVCSAYELTDVEVHNLPGNLDFDFVRADESILQQCEQMGIYAELANFEVGGQMMKLIFDEKFVNSLENSEKPYVFEILAIDVNGKQTTANLVFNVNEAPVFGIESSPADVTYSSVTFHGQVAKDNIECVGFVYREKGNSEWSYIEGQAVSRAAFAKDDIFSATVTMEEIRHTTFEYKAVSGTTENPTQFESELMTISTKSTPQLPNGDMEQWSNSGTKDCVIPALDSKTAFWDCGNHGSITMGKNVTDKTTEKRHSGSYAAKLQSEFVGVGSLGKLAAGNICVGKYLKTDGTDGVFGFGREFDFEGLRPKALRVWVHYTPVAVTHTGAGATLNKGDMDMAHLFVALFDSTDPDTADGVAPFIVRTKTSKAKYFDKNADWIMAYGEKILTEATPGSDLVELVIPIDYKAGADSRTPRYIAIVCTASKEGDFYTGGSGSTLYVDDFEIVY